MYGFFLHSQLDWEHISGGQSLWKGQSKAPVSTSHKGNAPWRHFNLLSFFSTLVKFVSGGVFAACSRHSRQPSPAETRIAGLNKDSFGDSSNWLLYKRRTKFIVTHVVIKIQEQILLHVWLFLHSQLDWEHLSVYKVCENGSFIWKNPGPFF